MSHVNVLGPETVGGGEHLTESELAGLLDGDLAAHERARVEAHLDDCGSCQADLANAIRLVDSFRTAAGGATRTGGRRRWWYLAVGGAIAAGLASVLLVRPGGLAPPPESTVRQPLHGEDRGKIEPISPVGTISASGQAAFRWRPTSAGFYRFVLLAETGERLFSLETPDTVVTLPATITLSAGRGYFWRVDGIEAGIVSSTGSVRIAVEP